jgi:hypothetical protein
MYSLSDGCGRYGCSQQTLELMSGKVYGRRVLMSGLEHISKDEVLSASTWLWAAGEHVADKRIICCRDLFCNSQRISEGLVLTIANIPLDVFLISLVFKRAHILLVLQPALLSQCLTLRRRELLGIPSLVLPRHKERDDERESDRGTHDANDGFEGGWVMVLCLGRQQYVRCGDVSLIKAKLLVGCCE